MGSLGTQEEASTFQEGPFELRLLGQGESAAAPHPLGKGHVWQRWGSPVVRKNLVPLGNREGQCGWLAQAHLWGVGGHSPMRHESRGVSRGHC